MLFGNWANGPIYIFTNKNILNNTSHCSTLHRIIVQLAQNIDMILYLLVRSAPRAYILAFGYPADWIVIDVYLDWSLAYRDAIIMNSLEPWVHHIIEIELR